MIWSKEILQAWEIQWYTGLDGRRRSDSQEQQIWKHPSSQWNGPNQQWYELENYVAIFAGR